MPYKYLDKVNSIADLKALDESELVPLCEDIREFLVDKVGKSGGHLASNLGVTELTVAIHRVFDSPKDHIIFDVGHQSYIHKILTGRKEEFDNLRRPGGLSGFTLMRESEHDAFGAGHSSTSISAGLGYAEADKIKGEDNYTVCVIGDGAYTGGMAHEAINNCKPDLKLIIILNENGMSISPNKGAFASYLSRVRISKGYMKMKKGTTSFLTKIPVIGRPIKAFLSFSKNIIKKLVFRPNYFEELGLYYIGPIDGNDYSKIEWALSEAKRLNQCVIVHINTTKGKGHSEAESSPEVFHSVANTSSSGATFHSEFAKELISLSEEDDRVVAVTAAMGVGTGLNSFEEKYPDRYFDVGIAEQHALTFAAGLAAGGFKPFCAIYSTFLQRGYDNIVHDIALQKLPVKIIIDRAGLAVGDGATHHGIFDVAFLSHIPEIEIYAPVCYSSLSRFIRYAKDSPKPCAIRYPNSSDLGELLRDFRRDECAEVFYDFDLSSVPLNIFVTYGKISEKVIEAKRMLSEEGINCGIIIAEKIKPYCNLVGFLSGLPSGRRFLFCEEGIKNGGAGMVTKSMLDSIESFSCISFDICAIDDNFVSPTELCDIYDYAGLSPKKLSEYFRK